VERYSLKDYSTGIINSLEDIERQFGVGQELKVFYNEKLIDEKANSQGDTLRVIRYSSDLAASEESALWRVSAWAYGPFLLSVVILIVVTLARSRRAKHVNNV